MSVPISATIDFGGARCTPGIVQSRSTAGAKGRELLLDRVGEQLDLLVEEVEVGEDRADQSA